MNALTKRIATLSLAAILGFTALTVSGSQAGASIHHKPQIKEIDCLLEGACDGLRIRDLPGTAARHLDLGVTLPGTLSHDDQSFQVTWSIKGALKKAGKGLKKVYKKAVPSEIRSGVSTGKKWAKRGLKRSGEVAGKVVSHTVRPAGKAILNRVQNPYGKRCKPDRYGRPVCYLPAK